MRATKQFNNVDTQSKIAINTDELQAMLSCGRYSAVQIGEAAEARIQIGKRIFWNVEKIKSYINSISVWRLPYEHLPNHHGDSLSPYSDCPHRSKHHSAYRQYKLFQAQLGQLDNITQEDLDMQRRAYRLIVDHFERKRSEV